MSEFLTISGVARRLGIPPRKISDLFYARKLDDVACPIVDGRRLIPESYLPTLEATLRRLGVIRESASCH